MNEARILIGGDVVPTKSNEHFLCDGSIDKVFSKEVRTLFESVDFRVFNLETPLIDTPNPIEKEGPCFSASVGCIRGLKLLNPSVITLANNHILDQGLDGLKSTLTTLDDNGIPFVGVGNCATEANQSYVSEINGVRIGVYGCVEHEYTYATKTNAGANPFDVFDSLEQIRKDREKCDCLIVLYHGGKEYYEYPSPELQRRCHKIVEAGANIVICQHSHCIGTFEQYMGGKILYGQGNLLLDRYEKVYEKYFQTGLLVEVSISKDDIRWTFHPIIKDGASVRLATQEEKNIILGNMSQRADEIQIPGFVEKHFRDYVSNIGFRYIVRLSRFGFIISSIDNRFFKGKLLNRDLKAPLGRHQRLALENCLQCEVHNEVVKTYLSKRW